MSASNLSNVLKKAGRTSAPSTGTLVAASAPVGVPPYNKFPVSALPDGLREYVVGLAAAIGCDPVFVALPALALAAAAVGNALVARVTGTWSEPASLWLCLVADSGTGKSPALKHVLRIALDVQQRLKAEYLAAVRAFKRAHADWKASADPDPEKEPFDPVRAHFAVSDATIEKLIVLAGDSPRGLLMVRDELAGWFGSFTRYRGRGGGSDLPLWLSMYDAGPTSYQRRGGNPPEVECDRTFVSLYGGIQPAVLKDILADRAYQESGLSARIGFAMPPKACLRFSDAELPAAVDGKFRAVVDALTRLPFDPQRGPTPVPLDPAAVGLVRELKDEFAERAEAVDGGPLSAVLPKATGQAVRLALVHYAVTAAAAGSDPGKSMAGIGTESMEAGIALARWFAHEAERVNAMLGETDRERTTRSLCEFIARKGTPAGKGTAITVRALVKSKRFPTSAAATAALDEVAAGRQGAWSETPNPRGGHPDRRFLLFVDTTLATRHSMSSGGEGEAAVSVHRQEESGGCPPPGDAWEASG